MTLRVIPILALTALLCACTSIRNEKEENSGGEPLSRARLFELKEEDGYTRLTIRDAWREGEIMERYYLTRDSSTRVPSDGAKLLVPLRRIVMQSASHAGYLDALGLTGAVAGACSPQTLYTPSLRERYRNGTLIPTGDPFNTDLEAVLTLHPDAYLVTGYGQSDPQVERLRQTRVPIVTTIEWMEPDILGRAEWLKVYGALFDCKPLADSLFNVIESRFDSLASLTENAGSRPALLPGNLFKETWYVPGGRSYMARLFRQAGGAYRYENDTTSGSLPLSFESVLLQFGDADYWIGADARSYGELLRQESRYTLLRPVKERHVYNTCRHSTADGGNDFWESALVRPDRFLEDLIRLLHPECLPEGEFHYLQPLSEEP